MKQIEKTRTITETKYQAIDGTEFDDKNECLKYDNTALAVMMAKYKSLVINSMSEWDLFGVGCDDNICDIVKLTRGSEYVIMWLLAYYHSYSDEKLQELENKMINTIESNDVLIINRGYSSEEFWLCNTALGIINKITSKCKINSVKIEFENEF